MAEIRPKERLKYLPYWFKGLIIALIVIGIFIIGYEILIMPDKTASKKSQCPLNQTEIKCVPSQKSKV